MHIGIFVVDCNNIAMFQPFIYVSSDIWSDE
jgi:hypothetical protein